MKKIALLTLLATAFAVQAADFVSVDVDHVKDLDTHQISTAQYVRAGKEIAGLQYGLQSRTSRYHDGTGVLNSLEVTVGKTFSGVTPFVGLAWDNGFNGAKETQYGLAGVTAGTKVGPGFGLVGLKTRINDTSTKKDQTVVFGTYSVPVVKNVALNLNVGKSYQDIRENSYGLGVTVGF